MCDNCQSIEPRRLKFYLERTGQQTETGTLKSSVLVSADNAFLREMVLNLSV